MTSAGGMGHLERKPCAGRWGAEGACQQMQPCPLGGGAWFPAASAATALALTPLRALPVAASRRAQDFLLSGLPFGPLATSLLDRPQSRARLRF